MDKSCWKLFLLGFFISVGSFPGLAIEKIGVIEFIDKSDFAGRWDISGELTSLLKRSLAETGRYKLVPRLELERMAKNHRIRVSRLLTTSTQMVDIGKCLGLKALIGGEITEFDISATGGQTQMLWPWAGGYVYYKAIVKIKFKILKPLRLIVKPITVEERETKMKIVLPDQTVDDLYKLDEMEFGSEEFYQTTIGKAVQKAIKEMTEKVLYEVPATKGLLEAQVLRVVKKDVYINLGSSDGVEKGKRFRVYAKGEKLKDPKTGLILGYTDKEVGIVEVTVIKGEHLAKARIVTGEGRIEELNEVREIPVEIPSE